MFQFHTPGSKALPFTFLAYGSCTLEKKKKEKKIKNSLLVCYCIQNQTKHGEMSLNISKLLLEKVLFGFCFQAELQTRQRICVFSEGPAAKNGETPMIYFPRCTALD